MGLKRKVSALEETSFQPPSSPPSLVSASTQSSPSSLCTEPGHQPLNDTQWTNRNHSAPWLNLRTRKRTRDNRPSETQVYSHTIQKLFDGQKLVDEGTPLPLPLQDEAGMDLDTDMLEHERGFEMTLEPGLTSGHSMTFSGSHPLNAAKQQNVYEYDFFGQPCSNRHRNPMHSEPQGSAIQPPQQTTLGFPSVSAGHHNHDFNECPSQH